MTDTKMIPAERESRERESRGFGSLQQFAPLFLKPISNYCTRILFKFIIIFIYVDVNAKTSKNFLTKQ